MNRNVTRFVMADRAGLHDASDALGKLADVAFSADHEGLSIVVAPEDGARAQAALAEAGLAPAGFEPFGPATDEEEAIFRSIEQLPGEAFDDPRETDATYVRAWDAWV